MTATSDKPYELRKKQIKQLLKIAHLGNRDIFCDVGCATGRIIVEAAKEGYIKKAIGIENEVKDFRKAWLRAVRHLNNDQLWLIDIQLADMQTFNFSRPNIIYYSLEEDARTLSFFQRRLGKRKVKILTKDLPFVGIRPSKVNRADHGCWFFLMDYPFTAEKSLERWITQVLGKQGDLGKLKTYYHGQIFRHYPGDTPYARNSLRILERLIKARF